MMLGLGQLREVVDEEGREFVLLRDSNIPRGPGGFSTSLSLVGEERRDEFTEEGSVSEGISTDSGWDVEDPEDDARESNDMAS